MNFQGTCLRMLHDALLQQGLTIATAESLTGGMIASRLTSLSGASGFFKGGIVAYSLEAKTALLGVNREAVLASNGVCQAVASQMAYGAQQAFGADCAIGVTGYAEAPPPSAWVQEAPRTEPYAHYTVRCKEKEFSGVVYGGPAASRAKMRELVTDTVILKMLDLLQ